MAERTLDASIRRAAHLLKDARRVVVLTGAGVSAESGIPTFRDAMTGLWEKFRPEDLATPEAFARDPETVTRWYEWRLEKLASCAPNAGHKALAVWQKWLAGHGGQLTILTQNVDGLHQAAGATGVIELHGSIRTWRCTKTGREETPAVPFAERPVKTSGGGLLRPGVVWFGEALPERALVAAAEAIEGCEAFLSIGTSSVVYPAAGLWQSASAAGAKTVEINPEPTPITRRMDCSVRGKSAEVLPLLLAAMAG